MEPKYIRFRLTEGLRLRVPDDGPRIEDGCRHTAEIACPGCHRPITLYAEVSKDDLARVMDDYAKGLLDCAQRLVGWADEFFEQTSGQNYRRSIYNQMLRELERTIRRRRTEIKHEGLG